MKNFFDQYWLLKKHGALLFEPNVWQMHQELKQRGIDVARQLGFNETELRKKYLKLSGVRFIVPVLICTPIFLISMFVPSINGKEYPQLTVIAFILLALSIVIAFIGTYLSNKKLQTDVNTPLAIFTRKVSETYFSLSGIVLWNGLVKEFKSTDDWVFVPHIWDMYLHLKLNGVDVLAGINIPITVLLQDEKKSNKKGMLIVAYFFFAFMSLVIGAVESISFLVVVGVVLGILGIATAITKRSSTKKMKRRYGITYQQFEQAVCNTYRRYCGKLVGHAKDVSSVDTDSD